MMMKCLKLKKKVDEKSPIDMEEMPQLIIPIESPKAFPNPNLEPKKTELNL